MINNVKFEILCDSESNEFLDNLNDRLKIQDDICKTPLQ